MNKPILRQMEGICAPFAGKHLPTVGLASPLQKGIDGDVKWIEMQKPGGRPHACGNDRCGVTSP